MPTTEVPREALLDLRYGNQLKPDNIIWTDQVEAMLRHCSVRTFLPEALPDGALETMVAAAQSASTSSAHQQWSVVAVTDPDLKQRLADTIARTVPTDRIPWIEEAPAVLLWVADLSRSVGITEARGGVPLVPDYLDAFLMASVDAALASQNASLAAESLGLGIVYLGVMRNAAREVAELVNLPPHSFVTFGMAVGRPDPERPGGIRPRLAQSVVLHHDRYDRDGYREHLDAYEAAYRRFREARGMSMKTWQDSVHEGTTSLDYMGGRERLRTMVTERGFGLG
jgi:nitroreductase